MNLTKKDIESLAKEIRQFLIDNSIWIDATIYFNGQAFSSNHEGVLEDQDPADYFEYVASPHILSMSFEGPLYGCLNHYGEYGAEFDNLIVEGFSRLLSRYGLYYELGNHWNLSCYEILPKKETVRKKCSKKAPDPIYFRGDSTWPSGMAVPEKLIKIQQQWKEKADQYGDVGSCVLGAGFSFTYEGQKYFMASTSCWQGSISWEHCKDEIEAMLIEAGATEIRYEWGNMD